MEYTIRKATPEDARGVALSQKEGWIFAHVNKEYGITEEHIIKHLGTDEELEKEFKGYLERKGTPYYVVEIDGEVMGYSGCYRDGEYWTGAVYLRPPAIGHDIGGELFQSVLDDLPKGDYFLVKIATFNERSVRLFKRLGFELVEGDDEYKLRDSDRAIPLVSMRKRI